MTNTLAIFDYEIQLKPLERVRMVYSLLLTILTIIYMSFQSVIIWATIFNNDYVYDNVMKFTPYAFVGYILIGGVYSLQIIPY
jgi:hypothetical protein